MEIKIEPTSPTVFEKKTNMVAGLPEHFKLHPVRGTPRADYHVPPTGQAAKP